MLIGHRNPHKHWANPYKAYRHISFYKLLIGHNTRDIPIKFKLIYTYLKYTRVNLYRLSLNTK